MLIAIMEAVSAGAGMMTAIATIALLCRVAGASASAPPTRAACPYNANMSKACICPKGSNHETYRFDKSVKRVWRCADCVSVSFDDKPKKCGACGSHRIVEDEVHFPETCYCFTCKRHFATK